jgi:hypothetical protein
MSLFVQPPPGTFGGTNGLGGADGFGGTGENNVMYAGLTLILFVCVAGFMPLNSAKTSICHTLIYRTSLQALRKQRLTRCLGLLYRQMPAKLAHRSGLGSMLHRPNILSKTTHMCVCVCVCVCGVVHTLSGRNDSTCLRERSVGDEGQTDEFMSRRTWEDLDRQLYIHI